MENCPAYVEWGTPYQLESKFTNTNVIPVQTAKSTAIFFWNPKREKPNKRRKRVPTIPMEYDSGTDKRYISRNSPTIITFNKPIKAIRIAAPKLRKEYPKYCADLIPCCLPFLINLNARIKATGNNIA